MTEPTVIVGIVLAYAVCAAGMWVYVTLNLGKPCPPSVALTWPLFAVVWVLGRLWFRDQGP